MLQEEYPSKITPVFWLKLNIELSVMVVSQSPNTPSFNFLWAFKHCNQLFLVTQLPFNLTFLSVHPLQTRGPKTKACWFICWLIWSPFLPKRWVHLLQTYEYFANKPFILVFCWIANEFCPKCQLRTIPQFEECGESEIGWLNVLDKKW